MFLYEGDNRADAGVLAGALAALTGAAHGPRQVRVQAFEAVSASSALCDDMDSAVEGVSAPAWALPVYKLATPAAWAALDD